MHRKPTAAAPALTILLVASGTGSVVQALPATGEVRVNVTVLGADRQKAPGAESVVWIPEETGTAAEKVSSLRPRIASKGKRFDPRITVVPAGTTIDFPNLDPIHHNVFSLSEKAKFDLGLYKNGASRTMTFDNPGLVRIYCNIHPQMAAYLLVVEGRFYARAGADGTAVLSGVPAGHHALRAWDEKGGDFTGAVDVAAGKTATVAIVLDGSSWRDVPHTNKYGRNYPPPNDDDNRY